MAEIIDETEFFGEPERVEQRIDGRPDVIAPITEITVGQALEHIAPKSVVSDDPRRIDPNVLPWNSQPNRMASFKHSMGHRGVVFYDRFTLKIKRWNGYSGQPIKLPPAFQRVPQSEVATCSQPGLNNRGCSSWNGCPYAGHGPFKLIIRHKDYEDVIHSNHCYNQWTGFNEQGNPISQIHNQIDGWVIDTSRRTIPYVTTRIEPREGSKTGYKRMRYAGEYEVKDLGPMYHETPPVVIKPEKCVGEVTVNEALAKWSEPSKAEVEIHVARSGGFGQGVSAQGGSGDGSPAGERAVRGAVHNGNPSDGQGRGGAPRGDERVGPGHSTPGVESQADVWRRDALQSPRKASRSRRKSSGAVQT